MASDSSRSFLRQLYPETGNANDAMVDVIAVHGLDPINKKQHAYNTWTADGKLWLKDFLPSQAGMPRLRVFLFGYNSSAAFQTSTVGVAGAAINLLDQLQFKRREHPDRPIVFVCHSLGGIVVKQALVEAHNSDEIHGSILTYTKGIAFFGTPHGGGHGARLRDSIVRVLRAVTGNVRNDIMEWLRTDSFLSNHLAENFARRAKNLRVVSFMENLPMTRHFGLVVPPSSSGLNWPEPAETRVLMEATHTTICKFSSQEDDLYLRVADHMLDLIMWAAHSVPTHMVAGESIDIPPPPYALELAEPVQLFKNTQQQEVSDKLPLGEWSDSEEPSPEEISPGWLKRVRAASPFRAQSSQPTQRSRASSTDEEIVLPAPAQPVWPIIMAPYPRNPGYVHRSEIWNQMISMMNKGLAIILQGVGGCGKTQTAIYLNWWFRDVNPDSSAMWINATSPDTSLAGLGVIASRMGITNTDGEAHRLMKLKDRLERPNSGRWLMILDAVDSLHTYDALREFLPQCSHGQILITSRRNLPARNGEFVLDLSKLTAFEGATLVHFSMKDSLLASIDPPDMDRLLRKLEYLALAVAQAVAFMNKNFVSMKLYLAKISDESLLAEQLAQNSISDDYVSGMASAVHSTFKISFERIASEQPEALRILGYLSFLDSRAVPADLVNLFPQHEPLNEQPITELESYSFVQWNEAHTSLHLMRLIQVATQRWLQETSQLEKFKSALLQLIADNFPDAADSKVWPRCEEWLPHAVKMVDVCEMDMDKFSIETPKSNPSSGSETQQATFHRALAQLKANVGFYYHKIGQWDTASDYLEGALETSRQNFGTMDELTLNTQAKLIETLRYLGKIKSASEQARDLKRARKAKLGKRDAATLQSYRLYALTLQDLGKWKDSLRAAEKALAGYRDLYKSDPTNDNVLNQCRRTASAYRMLGQNARAEALLREAIDGYRRRGEEASEPAAHCLYSLASLQIPLKQFHEAETSARECLARRETFMKPSHPDILKTLWVLGISLQGQRNWSEAERIFTDVLDQAQKKPGVGKKHIYSLQLLYSLGSLEEARAIDDESTLGEGAGRPGLHKARAIYTDVLAGRIEALGPEHLESLTTMARLAGVGLELGDDDLDGAERQATHVLKTVTSKEYRTLGVASAGIAWMCLSTLAGCAARKARYLDGLPGQEEQAKVQRKLAAGYARQMAEAMEKVLGKMHPDTLGAARAWAEALRAGGDGKAAGKVVARFGIEATDGEEGVVVVVAYTGVTGH